MHSAKFNSFSIYLRSEKLNQKCNIVKSHSTRIYFANYVYSVYESTFQERNLLLFWSIKLWQLDFMWHPWNFSFNWCYVVGHSILQWCKCAWSFKNGCMCLSEWLIIMEIFVSRYISYLLGARCFFPFFLMAKLKW